MLHHNGEYFYYQVLLTFKINLYSSLMTDVRLTDKQWTKIRDFLLLDPNAYVGKNEEACRNFFEAVKWVSRSGAQWCMLPKKFGKWNTIYKRFVRRCENGAWQRLFEFFADDPDMENGMIDSTIVRAAHPCATGAQ